MSSSSLTEASNFDTATRGHHPDSPSSLQSSKACPLFENQQRESKAASDGVLQHKAVETRDVLILSDEKQVLAVQRCIDYVNTVCSAKYAEAGEVVCLKEEYLKVGDDNAGNGWWGITGGFPDEAYIAEFFADIFDWKFGAIPVTPTKDNLQGMAYAVGLFEKYPKLQRVTVHFFQPHQGWTDEEHKKKYVHTFQRTDVPEMELLIRTVVARKKAAKKRLAEKNSWTDASPRHDLCIWCAHQGDCAKMHAVVIRGAEKNPEFIVPEIAHPGQMQLSRPEQVKQAYRWANQVENIAKAIKTRARDMALTEDLDLGSDMNLIKRTNRKIKDLWTMLTIARRHGIGFREMLPFLTVSIGDLENAVKAKAEKGKGAAAVRALAQDWLEEGAVEMGLPVWYLQEARSPKEKANLVIEINN